MRLPLITPFLLAVANAEQPIANRRAVERSLMLLREGGVTRNPEALFLHAVQTVPLYDRHSAPYKSRLIRAAQAACPGPLPPGVEARLREAASRRQRVESERAYAKSRGRDPLALAAPDRVRGQITEALTAAFMDCRYRAIEGTYWDRDNISVNILPPLYRPSASTVLHKQRFSNRRTHKYMRADLSVGLDWMRHVHARGLATVDGRLVMDARLLSETSGIALMLLQHRGSGVRLSLARLRRRLTEEGNHWHTAPLGELRGQNWSDILCRLARCTHERSAIAGLCTQRCDRSITPESFRHAR